MSIVTPDTIDLIDRALVEDAAFNDITTDILVPDSISAEACFVSKTSGVLAGVDVALAVFRRVDASLTTTALLQDGSRLSRGTRIATVSGRAASILKAERTAVNLLQRMSGVATETSRYVEAVKGLNVRIVETRKTTPGLRTMEKYAVRVGGGHNHRFNLADGILIKDNHIAALKRQGYSLSDVVRRALENAPHTLKVEVEVTTLEETREAAEAGAHAILLDNMPLDTMREAVRLIRGRALVEASGGITLETVRAVAETGVDIISVGALTHSVKSLDISLEIEI